MKRTKVFGVIIVLGILLNSCAPYRNISNPKVRLNEVNKAYPNLDLYPHPWNETEIIGMDWEEKLVFLIKIGGYAPYSFIVLDKAINSDFIKNPPKNK